MRLFKFDPNANPNNPQSVEGKILGELRAFPEFANNAGFLTNLGADSGREDWFSGHLWVEGENKVSSVAPIVAGGGSDEEGGGPGGPLNSAPKHTATFIQQSLESKTRILALNHT